MMESNGQVYLGEFPWDAPPLMSLLFEWTTDKLEQAGVGGPVSGVDQEKSTDQ